MLAFKSGVNADIPPVIGSLFSMIVNNQGVFGVFLLCNADKTFYQLHSG